MSNSNIEDLLKDTEIQTGNIGLLFKQKGLIAILEFKGGEKSYAISPKAFGVKSNQLSKESQEFLDKHVRKGSVTLIPKDKYDKLKAIESKTRKKLKEMSTGEVINNSYLTMKSFFEFKDYFEKAKDEYMEIGEQLVNDYDKMLIHFKEIVKKAISDMDAYESKAEYDKIMRKLPSKKQFKESFSANLYYFGLPTISDLNGIDKRVQEQMEKQYREIGENLVEKTTISIINEAFSALISVFKSDKKKSRIHHNIIKGLKNSIKKMGEKNIFGNEKLAQIRVEMEKILNMDMDNAIENSEILIAELYMYAKELNVENKVDLKECPLTTKELETIYELYN